MALISGLLVLGLLCAFALCVGAVTDLDPALLLLPGIAAAVLVLAVTGMFSLLPVGLWLALGAMLLASVCCGVRAGSHALRRALYSPGFLLFAGGALFFWLLFAVQQPMFTQWDEFTAWGAAAKLLKTMDAFYVAQPYSLTASHTFPAGGLTGYLFAAFSPVFAEWACLAALNTLLLACVAAAAAIAAPAGRWPHGVLVFAIGALLPQLFSLLPAGAVSVVYQNAMADVPLGLLFGGVICLYCAAGRRRTGVLLTLCPLALLVLFKDIAFAYGLIAAFVLALEQLFCAPRPLTRSRPAAWGMAAAKAGSTFLLAAVPVVAAFLGWNRYVAIADTHTAAAVGSEGLSYGAVLLGGVRQLLGMNREEKFAQLMTLMGQAFFTRRVFLAGSSAVVVLLMVLLAVCAWQAAPAGTAQRLRPLVVCGGLTFSFAALYAFHLILYHYNFAETEALLLKDYERYLGSYYIGWFLVAVSLLGQSAALAPKSARAGSLALGGSTLALVALVAWRGVPGTGFWSDADSLYTVRTDVQNRAAAFNEVLDWSDRVLVLSQGDDATRWYYYKYELTATVVNGWYQDPETGELLEGDFINLADPTGPHLYTYTTPGDGQMLIEYMRQQGCSYLLIDRSDRYLVQELDAFTVGGVTDSITATLYRFEADSEQCFTPVAVAGSGVDTDG